MAVTITKVSGPFVRSGDAVGYRLSLLLDTSFATGGENLDLTDYLSKLHGGHADGCDAIADATRQFDVVGPGITTTLTATNVKLTAHHSAGADAVMNPSDGEDLSGIGALQIEVWGKAAIPTSWA